MSNDEEKPERALMPRSDLKKRSRDFALRVIRLVESLPNTPTARTIGGQLLRSSTSVAANYWAACRARSNADFIAKMGIVEEETDESVFWIEMLVDTRLAKASQVSDLLDEGNQLTAIWSRRSIQREAANDDSALRIPRSAF